MSNFASTNLYLASYLYAIDESAFIGLQPGDNTFLQFVFKPVIQDRPTTDIEKEYWNNTGSIIPKKYATAIRALKERIQHK